MPVLDILILVALAGGLVAGFASGVIRQVATIAGLILAFVFSVQYMHDAGDLVVNSLGVSESLGPLLGFVLIFLGVQVLVFAVVKTVEAIIGALNLTIVNRLLGGAFGAFKVALVLSVAFLVLGAFEVPSQQTKRASTLYNPVASFLPDTWDYLSERFPQMQRLSDEFGREVQESLPRGEQKRTSTQ